jgi:hypothetical protein
VAGEHSLTRALRGLLANHRTAALGTLDEHGAVAVSMVPFAIDPEDRSLVIHVSGLAAHTRHLMHTPRVSLLVSQAEVAGEPVHALPRVTLDAMATPTEPGSTDAQACRAVYLARFPEAEPMTALGDFRFVRLRPRGARQVAGFGAARSLDAAELAQALGHAP